MEWSAKYATNAYLDTLKLVGTFLFFVVFCMFLNTTFVHVLVFSRLYMCNLLHWSFQSILILMMFDGNPRNYRTAGIMLCIAIMSSNSPSNTFWLGEIDQSTMFSLFTDVIFILLFPVVYRCILIHFCSIIRHLILHSKVLCQLLRLLYSM